MVKVKELENLELFKIMIERFKKEEISIEELQFIRDFTLKANHNELFYSHKKAIDDFTKFINEKIKENNQAIFSKKVLKSYTMASLSF